MESLLNDIYKACRKIPVDRKQNAQYIKELARSNSEWFGIAVCTVKGETYSVGDAEIPFSLQSCSKPFLYAAAQELHGEEKVHASVGFEPSGRTFNAFDLDPEGKSFNPMINSGAIICSHLIPASDPVEKFRLIQKYLQVFEGGEGRMVPDPLIHMSERQHADNNYSLAYHLRNHKLIDFSGTVEQVLEGYFQACSIMVNCHQLAAMAATLANHGINPKTQDQACRRQVAQNVLTQMFMSGMYTESGRHAFKVGFPAKSGVSGCLMLVIPGEMGVAIYSPPLNKHGNSIRGVQVTTMLRQEFPHFHMFRYHQTHTEEEQERQDGRIYRFITAASRGDMDTLRRLLPLVNVNATDYDGRSALALAVSEEKAEVIEFLLNHGAQKDIKDRWGNVAYHQLNSP